MRLRMAALTGALLFALVGCTAPDPEPPATAETVIGDGHGEIAGAQELAEPALHLTTVSPDGVVDHLELLDEETSTIAEIDPIDDLVTNGRYLFGVRDGSVTVVDSGVWSWNHVDHFHYYEAPSRVVGEVEGAGVPTVVAGETGIGILFDGEAVLLDTAALADGEIVETFRIPVEQHQGLVVPLDSGAAVSEPDAAGDVQQLRLIGDDGTEGDVIPCADASGSIATNVGTVVGCADGALLFAGGDPAAVEEIALPEGAGPAATSFDARKWRPTVAGTAGENGIWLLDTRERTWEFIDAGEPIVAVSAVDDEAGHVIALAETGAVLVLADGAVVGRTEPLVSASLADPDVAAGIGFVVDQQRVYLNGPLEQKMWEIAPADDGRIARTFDTATQPLHVAGTGR